MGIQKLKNENATETNLEISIVRSDADRIEIAVGGYLMPENAKYLKDGIEGAHSETLAAPIILDCKNLEIIVPPAASVISELIDSGVNIKCTDMNQDCYAAMWEAGLDGIVETHMEIPHYDVSDCEIIGEGANGRVYRINDELIMKTFKNKETLYNILKERYLTKCAFLVGVPCPISFGLAEVEGKLALLMEFVKSKSLAKLIRSDDSNIEKYAKPFVELIKNLHNVKGEDLECFPRKVRLDALLTKVDRLDEFMDESHKGKLRKLLENIDEEEVLIHGDLQPANIRVSEDGLSFIDLETISTGPEIFDVGAIRRALHCDWEFSDTDYSEFMKLSKEQLLRIWDAFVREYYAGQDEKTVEKNLYLAEIIGDTMSAWQYLKRGQMDQLHRAVARLEELI